MRYLVTMLLVLTMVTPGFAYYYCPKCSTTYNEYINSTDEFRSQEGIGVDLTVWQNKAETVGLIIEEKYDFHNDNNSVFGVLDINLWKMFKK